MSQTEIGFIGIGVLLVILMLGVHVGFALIVVGVAGMQLSVDLMRLFRNIHLDL
jgi:hypothetical protein